MNWATSVRDFDIDERLKETLIRNNITTLGQLAGGTSLSTLMELFPDRDDLNSLVDWVLNRDK